MTSRSEHCADCGQKTDKPIYFMGTSARCPDCLREAALREEVGRLCAKMNAIHEGALDQGRQPTTAEWRLIQDLDAQAKPLQLELMAIEGEREAQRQAEHQALLAQARALLKR